MDLIISKNDIRAEIARKIKAHRGLNGPDRMTNEIFIPDDLRFSFREGGCLVVDVYSGMYGKNFSVGFIYRMQRGSVSWNPFGTTGLEFKRQVIELISKRTPTDSSAGNQDRNILFQAINEIYARSKP